jgi:hypothetical protein
LQEDILVGRINGALVFGIFSCYGLKKDCLRQAHTDLFAVFVRRDKFPAGNARHIRDDGFNLVNPVVSKPLANAAVRNRFRWRYGI